MFGFSYKNRIAFNYIQSTGLLISLVFLCIYFIIKYSVNEHVNSNLRTEVSKHLDEIEIDRNNTYLIQVDQWRAREHNTVNVNPVFVQFSDVNGDLIDKSPNLKYFQLKLYPPKYNNKFIDTFLNNQEVRQIQVPLYDHQKMIGHLFVAMSLEEVTKLMTILTEILLIAFPFILIVLFFIARLIAGRSIKPVRLITATASSINKDNLKDRIVLPRKMDELYVLSKTINDLLDRIENAVEREKQFTSDASHELRTPLAVIKGTLEVLARKPRTQEEYESKIHYCVSEVDRLNRLVDELLMLARFENQKQNAKTETVYLNALLLDVLTRHSQVINEKKLVIKYDFANDYYVRSDEYLVSIILSNLLSNAIKYSKDDSAIKLELYEENGRVVCTIIDQGIGIIAEDFDKILKPFFRSQALSHPEIKGIGLGLSIVNRLCYLLKIEMNFESQAQTGTTVRITFP